MRKFFFLLLLVFSSANYAQESLKIAVISDTHYLSSKLAAPGDALNRYEAATGRNIEDLHAVLKQVITDLKAYQPDLLLISGDLTNHGERESHLDFVEKLKLLSESGTRIFVIPGNHDVNVPNSLKYEGDSTSPATNISAQEFAQIYAPYGYASAIKRDSASLSYLAEINDSIWLIGIDSNLHKEYKTSTISAGRIHFETLRWAIEILQEAKSKEILVLGMMHHGLVEHMPYQAVFFSDYLIDDWKENARLLADNGLKILFTGHFHSNDITLFTTPNGNTIYDIQTGTLAGYPFPYRLLTLQNNVMHIETKFVESIPGKPNLKEEYRQKTERIAQRAVEAKINSMTLPIPAEMKDAMINLLVKMQLLHMKGDEKIDGEMLELIKRVNSLVGDPEADFSSFELDFPPADNFLKIELK